MAIRLIITSDYSPTLLSEITSQPLPCFTTTLTEIRLELLSDWDLSYLSDNDPFIGTLAALQNLSGRNVIETVRVEITLDESWLEGRIVQESWLGAAATFKDKESFPYLKEFTLEVIAPIDSNLRNPPQGSDEGHRVSGERLAEDLLKVPFDTLDLPYKFDFSATATDV